MKEGWKVKKLGEVCITSAGGTPLKSRKEYYKGGDIPWLLSGEVSQGEIYKAKNFITENGLKNSSAKLFPPDTVLIAMYGATAGAVGILKFEACTNQAVCGILPNNNFDPYFLFYCFLSKKEELVSQAVGNAQPNISQTKIKNTRIPIPPLPEQQRIVSILDHCFEAIDKAKANAEQNLQNAKELFESYLQGVFEKKGEGWEEKKLGKICDFVRGPFGGSLKKSIFKPEGYAVYEQRHAIYNQFDNVRYFVDDEKFNEMKRFELKPGNLIMSCSGTMGKIAIAPEGIKKGIINQALLKLAPSAKITPYYLKYWMESESFQDSLKEYSGGAAIQNVASVKILKQIVINVPSLSIQDEVVKKLDDMYEETQRLEIHYQKRIDDLEELKKSILQKAFAGELKTEKMVEETPLAPISESVCCEAERI